MKRIPIDSSLVKLSFLLVLPAAFLSMPATTIAQEQNTIEEIIVTAERRETSIQNTPIAVSAFTGREMERAGTIDPYQMAAQVPNMMVTTRTTNDSVFISIRGVTGTGSTPTTAFHMDGAYIPQTSGRSAYFLDIERMEVLRGPQGTLWGRNSTSGSVNVITNKPDLSGFDASAEITVGDFDLVEVRGMVNIPLSETVGARIAYLKSDHDGYVNNGPLVVNGNDADDMSVRLHLLWQISDASSLLLTADAYRREGVGKVTSSIGCPAGTAGAPVGGCNQQGSSNPDPDMNNLLNFTGHRDNADNNFTLTFKHSLNSWDLTYLTSFREHDRDEDYDQDATADWDGRFFTVVDTESVQHQLVLTSNFDGPFQAVIGGFWLDDETDSERHIHRPAVRPNISPSTGLPIGLDRIDVVAVEKGVKDKSIAAFFNGTYAVSDKWNLTAGLRYTEDERSAGKVVSASNPTDGSFRVNICCVDSDVDVFLGSPPHADIAKKKWDKVTWRVGLDYAINDDMMTYLTASTGYKTGGFNPGTNDSLRNSDPNLSFNIPFAPEEVDALEWGIKTQFMDGRAQLNVTLFDYDYTNMQQSVVARAPDGFTNIGGVFNVGEATIRGLELEGVFLFGESGVAKVAFGYLDAEFDEFSGVNDPLTPGNDNLDLAGNEPINAPEFNGTLILEPIVWRVGNGSLSPRLQIHFESDAWVRVLNDPGVDKRDSYTRTDVSLRYETDDKRFYLEGWVRNLEDEPIRLWGACTFNVAGTAGPSNVAGIPNAADCRGMYGQPRTMGITFGVRM